MYVEYHYAQKKEIKKGKKKEEIHIHVHKSTSQHLNFLHTASMA